MTRKILVACGTASSVLYLAMDIFARFGVEGYNSASMTVSELSAIGAPTRTIWVSFGVLYTLVFGMFSLGVWRSAVNSKVLQRTSVLLMMYTVANLIWPLFPMHQREALAAGESSFSDTMHLVMAGVTVLIMVSAMGFSAFAFDLKFKVYALASIVTQLFFGILTSIEAPGVDKNLPTPTIGIWERINIAVFLLWVVVLSVTLLKKASSKRPTDATTGS